MVMKVPLWSERFFCCLKNSYLVRQVLLWSGRFPIGQDASALGIKVVLWSGRLLFCQVDYFVVREVPLSVERLGTFGRAETMMKSKLYSFW